MAFLFVKWEASGVKSNNRGMTCSDFLLRWIAVATILRIYLREQGWKNEIIAVTHIIDHGLSKDGSMGSSKKCLASGCILKVEPRRFPVD